jgi:hypothetical protein
MARLKRKDWRTYKPAKRDERVEGSVERRQERP